MTTTHRRPQACVLGSAEPGSRAFALAGDAGEALARWGVTVVSGCGSPATRVAAERALGAGGEVLSIVPPDEMPPSDWPATVVVPCGMGDARNLLMALAGDACLVIGGRAGTKSEVHLAWLHRRPLLPLVGCGGWSEELPANPPDERGNSRILPWRSIGELESHLRELGLVHGGAPAARLEHVAIWARDIDAVCGFHAKWFGAVVGAPYENPGKGFRSRFLSFAQGPRIEVMSTTSFTPEAAAPGAQRMGLTHLALSLGSEDAVDRLTAALRADGVTVLDGPRRTGDGYYESVVLDPEGTRIELTA